ncbi:MAG: ATP-grasp domain-containing protein [bacterium]
MDNKLILVLGGGRHQVALIDYIQRAGYPVLLSDYLANSPGHGIAAVSTLTDALDSHANISLAKHHDVQGVITTGTDQPLVTMADVADGLGLPCYLTPWSARACTDKQLMFNVLSGAGIKIPRYYLVRSNIQLLELTPELRFPLVVKPIDSQGQRGITIAESQSELSKSALYAWDESSSDSIIIQEFVHGPEMTISAWVSDKNPQIMLITDRVTYNRSPATGVCLQHIYPSMHIKNLESAAQKFVNAIASAYQIEEGPLYIQCVRENDELHLIEASCRIGGGHEERLIEQITGINVHEHLLNLSLHGCSKDFPTIPKFPLPDSHALVNFLIARPGVFESTEAPDTTTDNPFGGFYYGPGYTQDTVINSMGRVGYFVCKSSSREKLMAYSSSLYSEFIARDPAGENLVYWPDSRHLNQ